MHVRPLLDHTHSLWIKFALFGDRSLGKIFQFLKSKALTFSAKEEEDLVDQSAPRTLGLDFPHQFRIRPRDTAQLPVCLVLDHRLQIIRFRFHFKVADVSPGPLVPLFQSAFPVQQFLRVISLVIHDNFCLQITPFLVNNSCFVHFVEKTGTTTAVLTIATLNP